MDELYGTTAAILRGNAAGTGKRGRRNVTTELEIIPMWPKDRECQQPLEADTKLTHVAKDNKKLVTWLSLVVDLTPG